jgi:hypothetical protein
VVRRQNQKTIRLVTDNKLDLFNNLCYYIYTMTKTNKNTPSVTEQRSIFHPDEFHALDMFEQRTTRNRNRLQALEDRRNEHAGRTGRTVMGALALVTALGALGGGLKGKEEPITPVSNTIPVTEYVNGHKANITIATENATPAQRYAQVVRENGGELPGTP